jgi:predicted signal transduction protein with EAL and GGDEF domain
VETASQLAALRELGCTFGQGYHFAKPLDAGGVEELLEAGGVYADPVAGASAPERGQPAGRQVRAPSAPRVTRPPAPS